jgi:hypothetical protein
MELSWDLSDPAPPISPTRDPVMFSDGVFVWNSSGVRLLKVDWYSFQKSNCCGLIGTTGNKMCVQVDYGVARHAVAKFVLLAEILRTATARHPLVFISTSVEDYPTLLHTSPIVSK